MTLEYIQMQTEMQNSAIKKLFLINGCCCVFCNTRKFKVQIEEQ